MKRPDKYEKIVDPYSKDIAGLANILARQGKEIIVLVDVTREAFKQGKKPEIVEKLHKYGTIIDNAQWSRLVALKPHTLDDVKKLEEDYYNDKLGGVRALEISTKSVVYCGRTLDDYLSCKQKPSSY